MRKSNDPPKQKQRTVFVATHRIMLHGLTHRVKREGDHWITQGGEKCYAGFVEKLPVKEVHIPPGVAEELWRSGAAHINHGKPDAR